MEKEFTTEDTEKTENTENTERKEIMPIQTDIDYDLIFKRAVQVLIIIIMVFLALWIGTKLIVKWKQEFIPAPSYSGKTYQLRKYQPRKFQPREYRPPWKR